jgi:SAM-dependent methyltransferase
VTTRQEKCYMNKISLKRRFSASSVGNYLRRVKYAVSGQSRYDPQHYWTEQLDRFGRDLRGPGISHLSEEENARLYRHGELALDRLFNELDLNWNERFAEIGPGNGYWLRWLKQRGVRNYTAFDLTDVLFPLIHEEFPDARLVCQDVTKEKLPEVFDVILMIDVTQHIVVEKKFDYAMRNCRQAIQASGHFIVTSWLQPYQVFSSSEVMRPIESYTRHFSGWKLTGPIAFRDKSIFALTKPIR